MDALTDAFTDTSPQSALFSSWEPARPDSRFDPNPISPIKEYHHDQCRDRRSRVAYRANL